MVHLLMIPFSLLILGLFIVSFAPDNRKKRIKKHTYYHKMGGERGR